MLATRILLNIACPLHALADNLFFHFTPGARTLSNSVQILSSTRWSIIRFVTWMNSTFVGEKRGYCMLSSILGWADPFFAALRPGRSYQTQTTAVRPSIQRKSSKWFAGFCTANRQADPLSEPSLVTIKNPSRGFHLPGLIFEYSEPNELRPTLPVHPVHKTQKLVPTGQTGRGPRLIWNISHPGVHWFGS